MHVCLLCHRPRPVKRLLFVCRSAEAGSCLCDDCFIEAADMMWPRIKIAKEDFELFQGVTLLDEHGRIVDRVLLYLRYLRYF